MQSSHTFTGGSAVFDEQNLVSAAGLLPALDLAEQTGLSELIGKHVDLPSTRVASGAVNPAGKLTSIIAAMLCGADSIDDANVLRAGGTPSGVRRGERTVHVGDLLARVHLRARQPARPRAHPPPPQQNPNYTRFWTATLPPWITSPPAGSARVPSHSGVKVERHRRCTAKGRVPPSGGPGIHVRRSCTPSL